MPAYDFRCKKCGFKFERTQKMDDPNPPCPWNKAATTQYVDECGGETEKLITGAAAVHFQGNGWAKDGYSK